MLYTVPLKEENDAMDLLGITSDFAIVAIVRMIDMCDKRLDKSKAGLEDNFLCPYHEFNHNLHVETVMTASASPSTPQPQ
jgi:hypothetical protein